MAILVAIGIFAFRAMRKNGSDEESARPAAAPAADPRPKSAPRMTMGTAAIIDSYGSNNNDMQGAGYYNDKQFQTLPPMPQAPAGQGYGNMEYGAYNASGAGGLPVAQIGPDGRYVA